MGMDRLQWLNWLKRPVEAATNPIKLKAHELYNSITNKQANIGTGDFLILQQKSEHLERENTDLKIKINDLEKENSSMKKLLGAPLPPTWKFIPAKVLNLSEGVMTINQGSDIGIKVNQAVIFEQALVGRVTQVNPNLSKLMLVNHRDTKIKVKVLENNVKGVIHLVAGKIMLDEVLQEANLAHGQTIITSGEEEIYPPNLIVGKIEAVEKQATAVYQQAVINPLVDYQQLEEVFVVKN
jgi:rod shape-determining protein MreC